MEPRRLSRKRRSGIPVAVLSSSLAFGALPAEAEPDAYVASTSADAVAVIDTATTVVLDTIPVGEGPVRVAITADGTRAYVANADGSSVSVIDTATNTVVATGPVAAGPSAVAVTPDGTELYVVAAGGVLQVLDTALIGTATDPVITTLSFGAVAPETAIGLLPDGSRAYAVISGALRVIDTATLEVLRSLYVGSAPAQLAIAPDGTRVYVTNAFGYDTAGFDGQLVVVDTATDTVLTVISLAGLPDGIAVTPDGTRAYAGIVARFWNNGYGMGFLPDTHVAVVDLVAGVDTGWILVPGTPAGVAGTPDGSGVYVAIPGRDQVAVIDTATDSLAAAIDVAAGPSGLAIAPPHVYVGCETGTECDDGDPCTDDFCDPTSGACSYTFNTAPCDDGNACSSGDVCGDGECAGAEGPDCNDGDPCTDDACDATSGACTHSFNTAPCDDGNPCTTSGVCDGHGTCLGSGCDAGASCGQLCGTTLTCQGNGESCQCVMP